MIIIKALLSMFLPSYSNFPVSQECFERLMKSSLKVLNPRIVKFDRLFEFYALKHICVMCICTRHDQY